MNYTKNHLALFVLSCALLLSACTGPEPESNIKLSDTKVSQTETTTETTNTSLSQPVQAQKGPMQQTVKKLEDFEKIAATSVTLKTTKGDITFSIFTDKVPLTAENFLNLAKAGFYDGIVFHRVIPDFMAQVGDPLTKDPAMQSAWGTGGPGYTIADEFADDLKHDSEGVVSMANAGPNTGGSQFFITYGATPWLDGKHAVFGKVTSGMDVLKSITQGDKIISVSYK